METDGCDLTKEKQETVVPPGRDPTPACKEVWKERRRMQDELGLQSRHLFIETCPLVQGKCHRTSSLVQQKLYKERSGVGGEGLQKHSGDTSWSPSID